jgi:hypothetical protein
MKKIGLILTCLLLLVAAGGCGQIAMTPDTLAAIAQAAGSTAGQASVPKVLTVDRARQVIQVVDALRPVAQAVQTPNEIGTKLGPAIDAQVAKFVVDPTARAIASAVISAGLGAGESYLKAHPDLAKQAGVAGLVADAALLGLRNGLAAGIAKNGG